MQLRIPSLLLLTALTATAPGMDKGHFGLVGVRERIESFNGDLHIESAPGRGTKVSICLKNHISLLFEKLGVSNRSEAAAIALRKQLVKM